MNEPDTTVSLTEVEQLRDRVALLEHALRPFAELGEAMEAHGEADTSPWAKASDATPYGNQGLTFGDLRYAAKVFSA